MANSTGSAREAVQWDSDGHVRLQHVRLTEDDLEWLRPVRRLTAWSVTAPRGLYARLPELEWLDVRGGSAKTAEAAEGCTRLRHLTVNQVRGLEDLAAITELGRLELLRLYGLPPVRTLPSLRALVNLRRIEIGSLKGLESIALFSMRRVSRNCCWSGRSRSPTPIRSGSGIIRRCAGSTGSVKAYR